MFDIIRIAQSTCFALLNISWFWDKLVPIDAFGMSAKIQITVRMEHMTKHRIFTMSVASVYPLYIKKVEKKGRTKSEVDAVICWLTGYSQDNLESQLSRQVDFETFFAEAPEMNPLRGLIKGIVCGVRVEDIEDPTMREIRYLDKLIDELAKGKALEKVFRN